MSLHQELIANVPGNACKLCTYIASLPVTEADDWDSELSLPVRDIGNSSVVLALRKRGVVLSEAAVRRHRVNHTV